MLMWPDYLPRAVEIGRANEEGARIAVAFNFMITGGSKSRP
jgi:hypothetical protein